MHNYHKIDIFIPNLPMSTGLSVFSVKLIISTLNRSSTISVLWSIQQKVHLLCSWVDE